MKQMKTGYRALSTLIAALLLCVSVSARQLIPGGNTVGMKVSLQGLLVSSVERASAAETAGLRPGDLLLRLGGEPLESTEPLLEAVSEGRPLALTVLRGGRERTILVQPTCQADGCRLGAAVRDHVAGIGTVSFYDPENGTFGALGHGIWSTGGTLLPITDGILLPSSVSGVVKGVSGTAGQLQGEFDLGAAIGSVSANTDAGVFGSMESPERDALEVASAEEVRTGAAVILANVSGREIREYKAEIVKIYEDAENYRDLLLRVTDPALLQVTGGIVQGMSGSPILQDGKLVGAVTHVLLNTPELGYGILTETMLAESEKVLPASAAQP